MAKQRSSLSRGALRAMATLLVSSGGLRRVHGQVVGRDEAGGDGGAGHLHWAKGGCEHDDLC
eukprot:11189841-Lingulodinium_polyedra.AAC.1